MTAYEWPDPRWSSRVVWPELDWAVPRSSPAWAEPCAHPSADGDEGPVTELGRMPTRWRCHACGQTFEDPAGEAEAGGA